MDLFIWYGLTLIAIVIILAAQGFVSGSYKKYSKVMNEKGISGREACRYILDKNGLNDIDVVETGGYLSDHYDPGHKVIRLSSSNYNGTSVGAVAVACHECGHAIQDKEGYLFMRIRSMLFPLTSFATYAGYIAIIIGIFASAFNFILIGIVMEVIVLLFQLVTLPVEFDASRRALKEINSYSLLSNRELKQGKVMLTAAALTYVASVISAVLEIIRLVLVFGGRDE